MFKRNDNENTTIGPNTPCSCGSGIKYKKCCALKEDAAKGSSRFFLRAVVIGGGLIFAVAVIYGNVAPAPQPMRSLPSIPATGSSNPGPWHYDVANDRHWHPGHSHWHNGPPPPPAQRNGAATTEPGQPHTVAGSDLPGGVTPEPWHYDVANDRHWHPEHAHWHPEHAHWHNGQPPANR